MLVCIYFWSQHTASWGQLTTVSRCSPNSQSAVKCLPISILAFTATVCLTQEQSASTQWLSRTDGRSGCVEERLRHEMTRSLVWFNCRHIKPQKVTHTHIHAVLHYRHCWCAWWFYTWTETEVTISSELCCCQCIVALIGERGGCLTAIRIHDWICVSLKTADEFQAIKTVLGFIYRADRKSVG